MSTLQSTDAHNPNATLTAQLHHQQSQIQTLRAAEEQFRMIFVNATVGIFQTSPDGQYLACNPALAKIYGYDSPEELQAAVTQISDQLYVEDGMRAKFAALIAKDGRVTAFEARIFRKDKRIIWISETAREVRDPDGKLLYYEGFVTDITAQKTAEESLRESEERYALSIRGAKDGVWDWNLRTGRIHFSARWKEMLGHHEDEINTFPQEWFDRVHPDDREAVQSAVAAHLDGSTPHLEIEHRMLHVDGAYRWMLSRGLAIRDENGKVTRMAGSQTDVTQRREAEEQLLRDALHDSLTGLPNRVLITDRIDRSIARITRDPAHKFAVLFLDLDRFKVINDSLGHAHGDQLLVAFTRRLTADLRSSDTAARLGGDEFTVLLEDPSKPHDAVTVAQRILDSLKEPFLLDSHEVFISASIGIAESSANYSRPQDVLRDADTAMYRAKARGKSCIEIFNATMHARAVKLLQMENDLRRALARNEFEIHYQPIVRIDTGRVRAFEALIRWNHPERGLIMPDEFITIAEETGLILTIGNWVLREACRQTAEWNALTPDAPIDINVNLSGRQFSQNDLVDQVKDALHHSGLHAQHLILEITESVVMENPEATIATLHRLKALGLKLNIDDFGTGYSSLAYLQRFPVDTMKIDRSFISCMGDNHENAEIVKTIVHLAHSLDMKVTAEGIEHPEQLAQLEALHCENAQGYLLSKPLPATAATTLLLNRDAAIPEPCTNNTR